MLERGLVKGEAELEITRGPFSPTLLPFDVYQGAPGNGGAFGDQALVQGSVVVGA